MDSSEMETGIVLPWNFTRTVITGGLSSPASPCTPASLLSSSMACRGCLDGRFYIGKLYGPITGDFRPVKANPIRKIQLEFFRSDPI